MPKLIYNKEFPSTTRDLGDALAGALDALSEHKWCRPEDTFCIRLCIEEALVNAVVHGNKSQPDRPVRIQIAEENGRCKIRVQDQGEGFDPAAVEMPDCTALGGRGVCLIKHYMENVSFDPETKSLEMEFTRDTFSCEV